MCQTVKKNPIHLVNGKGEIVRTFKSYDSLVHHWPFIEYLDIGKQHKIKWSNLEWNCEVRRLNRNNHYYRNNNYNRIIWPATQHDYILRDSYGDCLDPEFIKGEYNILHPRRFSWWCYPGSKRRGGYWLRRPHTTQERRWSLCEYEEINIKVRAKRNNKNLPSNYDDIPRYNWSNHNWKRFRKHQWK